MGNYFTKRPLDARLQNVKERFHWTLQGHDSKKNNVFTAINGRFLTSSRYYLVTVSNAIPNDQLCTNNGGEVIYILNFGYYKNWMFNFVSLLKYKRQMRRFTEFVTHHLTFILQ